MKLKTKEANNFFKEKNYKEALIIYKDLAKLFGYEIFKVNIQQCEKKLFQSTESLLTPKQENSINIAFITDINYAMGTYVAITTLIKNSSKKYFYNIYIFVVDMDETKSNLFYDLSSSHININIINKHKSNEKFLIKKDDGFHVSPAAIVKFELANTLTKVDKLLYLDGDIVVKNDLVNLYKTNLETSYAAVVEDMKPKYLYKPSILIKLNIESHNAYFNSGVMLLNLKRIREDNISKKLYNYRENGKNFFMDQDAFNVVFEDKVKYLDPINNFLTTNKNSFSITKINEMYHFDNNYKSYSDAYKKAKIIHFSSKHKPWNNHHTDISKLWYEAYIESKVYGKFGIRHEVEKTICLDSIIISYTSLSLNLNDLYNSIKSMMSQSFKPRSIVLWLPEDKFPNKADSLPKYFLELKTNGLILEWCKKDKPCHKLVPTINKYKNKIIINAEENLIYHKDWLAKKLSAYLQDNNILLG